MSPRDLLDPRYHMLSSTARRMHAQLDPGEVIIGLTLFTASSEGETLVTAVLADGNMQRRLVTDASTMIRVSEEATRSSTVALDIPDEAP